MEISLFPNCSILLPSSSSSSSATLISTRRSLTNKLQCSCSLSSSGESQEKQGRRRELIGYLVASAAGISLSDAANAVSTSRRALRGSKVPESEYTTLDNGLKYYDLKVGGGPEAVKGSRVAVHYVAKWKGITFMTSRQGLGVGGGTPYGFDVGQSERGAVLKGLDLGVVGMRVGGQRLLIVPPELAYGSKGVQEIPPNATIEVSHWSSYEIVFSIINERNRAYNSVESQFDVELLAIKQSPFGSAVKVVEG
ncbi:Peptidyl-prolyl cis-trans isomerase FKBP16-4, chloroplastic [Linum perenne]